MKGSLSIVLLVASSFVGVSWVGAQDPAKEAAGKAQDPPVPEKKVDGVIAPSPLSDRLSRPCSPDRRPGESRHGAPGAGQGRLDRPLEGRPRCLAGLDRSVGERDARQTVDPAGRQPRSRPCRRLAGGPRPGGEAGERPQGRRRADHLHRPPAQPRWRRATAQGNAQHRPSRQPDGHRPRPRRQVQRGRAQRPRRRRPGALDALEGCEGDHDPGRQGPAHPPQGRPDQGGKAGLQRGDRGDRRRQRRLDRRGPRRRRQPQPQLAAWLDRVHPRDRDLCHLGARGQRPHPVRLRPSRTGRGLVVRAQRQPQGQPHDPPR